MNRLKLSYFLSKLITLHQFSINLKRKNQFKSIITYDSYTCVKI